jgi:hypothetical protein
MYWVPFFVVLVMIFFSGMGTGLFLSVWFTLVCVYNSCYIPMYSLWWVFCGGGVVVVVCFWFFVF